MDSFEKYLKNKLYLYRSTLNYLSLNKKKKIN